MGGSMAHPGKRAVQAVAMVFMLVVLLAPLTSPSAQAVTLQDPLVVEGDAGFEDAGFSGSGTPTDPYVLSDLRVNATSELHGIFIANTTKHFRLVNCMVHDAFSPQRDPLNISASGSGIILVNVTNAEVSGYLSDYNVRGVTVVGGGNITISNSRFSNNIEAAVHLTSTKDVTIRNCLMERGETGKDGALLESCHDVSVLNNTVGDGTTGVRLLSSHSNLIDGNQISAPSGNGISVAGVPDGKANVVSGNNVRKAGSAGILVSIGEGQEVLGNEISECLYGVRLDSPGNTVSGNLLHNNTQGISISTGADWNTVSENTVLDGDIGVLVSPSQGNTVENNTILRMARSNASAGVYLGIGKVEDALILNNTVSQCSAGLRAASTASGTITGLVMSGNEVNGSSREGLTLLYVEDGRVEDNTITGSGGNGVAVTNCHNLTLEGNRVFQGWQYGLRMQGTEDSLVRGNVFLSNLQEGIYLSSGSGNVIEGNALVFNKGSGRQYSPLRSQAYCGAEGNAWYSGTGNLWADWLSPDSNEDGIVDLPYNISGGCQDLYPLSGIPGLIIPEDIVPPAVLNWTPTGDSVAQDSRVSVTFSEDMDEDSVQATVNGEPVDLLWNDRSMVLDVVLEFDVGYEVTVSGSDLAGNNMSEFRWEFHTEGPEATVSGRVVGPGSISLAGVRVIAGAQVTNTSADGTFSLVMEPGDHTVWFELSGYRNGTLAIIISPGQDMDVGDVIMVEEEGSADVPYWPLAIAAAVAITALVVWSWKRRK